MSSTRTFDQNIIWAKLDLNPILRVVDKVKNMGRQSETLAIHIKITYLNKELSFSTDPNEHVFEPRETFLFIFK